MQILKNLKFIFSILLLLLVKTPAANSTEECFEKTSRAIFKFNMVLDDAILEPIAKGYNKLPNPVKKGTSNTSNIATLLSIQNYCKEHKTIRHSLGSFAINTTVGIFGFLDPAEKIGLKAHKKNFNLWNGPRCYFVLPILGQRQLETQ